MEGNMAAKLRVRPTLSKELSLLQLYRIWPQLALLPIVPRYLMLVDAHTIRLGISFDRPAITSGRKTVVV